VPVILADAQGRGARCFSNEPAETAFRTLRRDARERGRHGYYRSQYDDGNFGRLVLVLQELPPRSSAPALDTFALSQAAAST